MIIIEHKRPKDMTPAELSALPLCGGIDGSTGKLSGVGINGDDIACFTDSSGAWALEYGGNDIGWTKRRMLF